MFLDDFPTSLPQSPRAALQAEFLSFIAEAAASPVAEPDPLCLHRVQQSCGTATALARLVLLEVAKTCKDLFGDERATILDAAAAVLRKTPLTWAVDASFLEERLSPWRGFPRMRSFATRLGHRVRQVFPPETTAGRKGFNEQMKAVLWQAAGNVEASKYWYQEAERSFARALAEDELTPDREFKTASCRLRALVELDRHVEAHEFSRRPLRKGRGAPGMDTLGDLLLHEALFGPRESYDRLVAIEREEHSAPMRLHLAWRQLLILKTLPLDLAGTAIIDLYRRHPRLQDMPST